MTGKPDGEEAAKALLSEFLKPGADHAALTQRLRPAKEDYAAVFEPEFARKVEAAQAPEWDSSKARIVPKAGQTQLLVYGATTEELKKWQGNAAAHFPGGYRKAAPKFKDGLTLYAFKFVEPGKTYGTAFDALVYVNGNWRFFPKPFRLAE